MICYSLNRLLRTTPPLSFGQACACKAHDIAPTEDPFIMHGDAGDGTLVLYGHLRDVTVSQALDYILQTFRGFWVYENCVDEQGKRTVRLSFHRAHRADKQQ